MEKNRAGKKSGSNSCQFKMMERLYVCYHIFILVQKNTFKGALSFIIINFLLILRR
jgi:hypothetical protein